MRLRVTRTCMMLRPVVTTSSIDGSLGSSSSARAGMSVLSRSCSLRRHSLSSAAGASASASARRRRPSTSELRSTAITISAPIARASDTGTGLTRAPSTSRRPSCTTGLNSAGRAIEARTAAMVEPSRSHTSAPLSSAVATAPKGMGSASIGRSMKCWRRNFIRRSPLIMPPLMRTSRSASTFLMSRPRSHCSKSSSSPAT